jgi:hypothetical protein
LNTIAGSALIISGVAIVMGGSAPAPKRPTVPQAVAAD